MATVTIQQAKAQLARLIKKACEGEEIIILRGRKPAVRLVAIEKEQFDRKPGAWKGKIKVEPEFFEPLPPEELEGWGVAFSPIPSTAEFIPSTANPRRFCGLH